MGASSGPQCSSAAPSTVGIFAVKQLPVFGTQTLRGSAEPGVGVGAHVSSSSHSVPPGQSVAQNAWVPERIAHPLPGAQLCVVAQGSQTPTISTGGADASGSELLGTPPRSTSVPHAARLAAARASTTDATLRGEAGMSLRGSMARE